MMEQTKRHGAEVEDTTYVGYAYWTTDGKGPSSNSGQAYCVVFLGNSFYPPIMLLSHRIRANG